ncbi:MAG: class I SAM-dependent methyltransferase [Chloroflexi bacterium]|nr:class I SAM-dependent methyltransferase [Chloroflexota bacterium]
MRKPLPAKSKRATTRKREPKLYGELAPWWHLLSDPADYADEAKFVRRVLRESCVNPPRTVLELGCGGGNNASHLKRFFQMTLVDRSREMLRVSRKLNPECEHIFGDMRTIRLKRTFDAVFIHDAIMYITTERDLLKVMKTAFAHCKPGGAVVIVPDCTRETFQPGTKHGGHDRDARGMRYLEWTYDPDPNDNTYITDFVYLLREANGTVRAEEDRHTEGLFPHATWVRLLEQAGFAPGTTTDQYGRVVFVGIKRESE